MNKYFFSSVLAAMAGIANAQSSVTLFGVVDTAVEHGSGSTASKNQMVSGAYNSSRIGFRGQEDLGGGLAASFWLESGISTDSGAGGTTNTNNQPSGTTGGGGLTFGRRSTVSLHGPWGEVRAGRDYSVPQRLLVSEDPFNNVGVGASQTFAGSIGGLVATRVSNFLGYYSPETSTGVYGFGQYYMGENPSNAGATAHDGDGAGALVGYKVGSLDVAVSTAKTQYAKTTTTGDIRSTYAGLKYNFGPVLLLAGYYVDKVESSTAVTGKGGIIGANWQIGASEIRAAYSQYKTDAGAKPETKKLALGYVYNLSKRTALYTTYARVRNSGGATTAVGGAITAANQSSSGFDLGVRHSF